MSLFADALRPHALGGLLTCVGPSSGGIRDAIEVGAYQVGASCAELELDYYSADATSAFFAADFARFASAAFESALDAEEANDGATPWRLIKLYYAAFYAGHALLRYIGVGCTQIPGNSVTRLKTLAQLSSVVLPFDLSAGLHQCHARGTVLALRPLSSSKGGGSHEQMWRLLCQQLDDLATDIAGGPLPATASQAVISQLIAYRRALKNQSRSDSWLCFMRNELQYRHAFDVWFPRRLRQRDRDALNRSLKGWRRDPMTMPAPPGSCDLPEFVLCCSWIVAACRELSANLLERGPKRTGFLHFNAGRLLRECGA